MKPYVRLKIDNMLTVISLIFVFFLGCTIGYALTLSSLRREGYRVVVRKDCQSGQGRLAVVRFYIVETPLPNIESHQMQHARRN